jgi:hypothetical protein
VLIPHAEIQVGGRKLLTVQDLNFNDAGDEHQYVPMRGAIALEKVVGNQLCEFSFDYEIPDSSPIMWRAYHRGATELDVLWMGAEGNYLAKCVVGNVQEVDPRAVGHKMTVPLKGYIVRAPEAT